MARRSPQNDRYKKDAKIGSTRRSAASAKPKRDVASAGGSSGSKSSKTAPEKKGRVFLPNPETPEFKRWNMLNYVALGVALAAAGGVLLVGRTYPQWVTYGLWVIWGIGLASSMYIQIKIIRPMRLDWERSGAALAKSKQLEEERASKAAERDKAKAEAAAEKAAKPGPKADDAAKVELGKDDE